MRSRRFQFSLRAALAGITLVAAVLASWNWYQWWDATKHIRRLHAAIQASDLPAEDKALLGQLVQNPRAWESGLIEDLTRWGSIKRIVWTSPILLDGRRCRIFLFDNFVKRVAGAYFPITCVVTTDEHALIYWDSLATLSEGFLRATLAKDGTLEIATISNWFFGKGVFKYSISSRGIFHHDLGTFRPFEASEKPQRPEFYKGDKRLRDAVKEARARDPLA